MSKFKNTADAINRKIGAMYIAMKRDDTPLYAKLACGLCVFYAVSPLDIIPDFVPVLGAVDDVVVLPFLMWLAVKLMPQDIMDRCIAQAQQDMTEIESKKRYMLPVLFVWGLLILWSWHLVNRLFFPV